MFLSPQGIQPFTLPKLEGGDWNYPLDAGSGSILLVFFATDCPTCQLLLPYLNRLAKALGGGVQILGISQDGIAPTRAIVRRLEVRFPILLDPGLAVSKSFDPVSVPALYLLSRRGEVQQSLLGFSKRDLNELAGEVGRECGLDSLIIAEPHDGAPEHKPGCQSRHLEPDTDEQVPISPDMQSRRGARASRIQVDPESDLEEVCQKKGFCDALPVVPPTLARVERMLENCSLPADDIIARVPPNYGEATVEKIAANAVMAGCGPEMMPLLIPLVRAACDERFNLHGVQATTHFAAPLIILNGPLRSKLSFASESNVFSNVSASNSRLGRAFQLILTNLGGARPGYIDMSTLGNPGKFSSCIAENEEASPWEPFHVEKGFSRDESTVTLFAAEPPRGVSEHTARDGERILRTICPALATIWSYRVCSILEALVVLCPEHAETLGKDGFSKAQIKEFLFDHTGIPVRYFGEDGGEGVEWSDNYTETVIDGERCYRKFRNPEAIQVVVAGGRAGKFSAVLGSWVTGPRGSQLVTYPVPDSSKVVTDSDMVT